MFCVNGIWRQEVFWATCGPGLFWPVASTAQPDWVRACREETFWVETVASFFQGMRSRVFPCGRGRRRKKGVFDAIVLTVFLQSGWSRVAFFVSRNEKQMCVWCGHQIRWCTCARGWLLLLGGFLFLPSLLRQAGWDRTWLRLRRPQQNPSSDSTVWAAWFFFKRLYFLFWRCFIVSWSGALNAKTTGH